MQPPQAPPVFVGGAAAPRTTSIPRATKMRQTSSYHRRAEAKRHRDTPPCMASPMSTERKLRYSGYT